MIKQISTLLLSVGIAACCCITGSFGAKTAKAAEQKYLVNDYFGGGEQFPGEETISYAYKKTSAEGEIKSRVPDFHTMEGGGSCANVAGAIMIAYYDRFCENLVPDYTTYRLILGNISYKGISSQTLGVMSSLYSLMGTDSDGTTFNGYQDGMRKYVQSHGYSYSYADVGNINWNTYVSSINNQRPIAIFLSKYTFLSVIKTNDNVDTILTNTTYVGHVVIAYGYEIEEYYNSNNELIAKRNYLKVASGFRDEGLAYLCLDGKSTIERAISTYIY